MDYYSDPNVYVRTGGGWGSARELAEKLIENNIQAAVERLASADAIDAIQQSRAATERKLNEEAKQAAELRALRQQALERDREELERIRQQQARERAENGNKPGTIRMVGSALTPAEERRRAQEREEYQARWAADNARIRKEQADKDAQRRAARAAHQAELQRIRDENRARGIDGRGR